jgi:pumilio RNA-binding family
MMTPTGVMTPSGAMTPTCKQPNQFSNASTAMPSGVQSPVCWADESDDESEGDADEACAELTAQIEAGGVARQAAIEALVGNVTELAFDASACRVVQKAIEFGEEEEVLSLSLELQGRVREAIRSPHANHVVQKMVEVMPASSLAFIVEEIIGAGAEFARHRYGCRVLCRLVQRHGEASVVRMDELIGELLSDASDLARHTFGHHVIEMVLQTGSEYQRHEIFGSLITDLMRNAKNRNATYVVERALTSCDEEDRRILVEELIGTSDLLVSLVENQFGCHVAKALLKISGETFQKMLSHIEAAAQKLQKSKYGRRLVEELKRIQAC